jgi:hypothetical protein
LAFRRGLFLHSVPIIPILLFGVGSAAAVSCSSYASEAYCSGVAAVVVGTLLKEEADVVQIVIQVPPDTALALHRGGSEASVLPVAQVTASLGLTLEPIHPATDDPSLIRWFIVEVSDPNDVGQVIESLEQAGAVDAAYVKPPDELP